MGYGLLSFAGLVRSWLSLDSGSLCIKDMMLKADPSRPSGAAPSPFYILCLHLLELCVPDAAIQALTVGLVLSQTKGIHVGGCFHLVSITIKVGYHQLFSHRGCPLASVTARSCSYS